MIAWAALTGPMPRRSASPAVGLQRAGAVADCHCEPAQFVLAHPRHVVLGVKHLAHPTTGQDTQTQHDHTPAHAPAAAPPQRRRQPNDTPPTDTEAQALAAYIRRIVDTAPRPNPAQLARLAGLLRNTGDSDTPS